MTRDLYGSLPGSHGTLGTVLGAEVECQPAKAIVDITLYTFDNDLNAGLECMRSLCAKPEIDFVEGIQYSSGVLAVMAGTLADGANHAAVAVCPDGLRDPWFYEYVEEAVKKHQTRFWMPVKSFLFRYDRGAFWMARPLAFRWNPLFLWRSLMILPLFAATHNNPLSRGLFRWAFTTRRLYSLLRRAHPSVVRRRMLIMDVRI